MQRKRGRPSILYRGNFRDTAMCLNWKSKGSVWRQGGGSSREERGKRLRGGGREALVTRGRGEERRNLGGTEQRWEGGEPAVARDRLCPD